MSKDNWASISKRTISTVLCYIPLFRRVFQTRDSKTPITFRELITQKVFRINGNVPWQVHFTSRVTCPQNINIGVGTAPGFMPGCYIQGIGRIEIGSYTLIGPNVGIISANHDPQNVKEHQPSTVKIGNYCWIGMNAVVLPGVSLGDHTIVAAGSVVTKSFTEGYCVIGGNPAKKIKPIHRDSVEIWNDKYEYRGYKRVK